MAGNARFHNKLHRRNHHSIATDGYPDSATDPIASPEEPFYGDFVLTGNLSAQGNGFIDGNLLVTGNLSALGDFSYVDTIVTVTSALSVINTGTGPALAVIQYGAQPVAQFIDKEGTCTLLLDDGGRIGINTCRLQPGIGVTINNNLSSNNSLTANANFGNYHYLIGSVSEGQSFATGTNSHAEGVNSYARGTQSHAEGYNNTATGQASHAEGYSTSALGIAGHAEGYGSAASGTYSHAEGSSTVASGNVAHAEGVSTVASGSYSHTQGSNTSATNTNAHAEGTNTTASGVASHAEGSGTIASGIYSHAEGINAAASGLYSHAEGQDTIASGEGSHAEGDLTRASGISSHAEGDSTVASGYASHTQGQSVSATANYAHAEGSSTQASGTASHAQGTGTLASNTSTHAEGYYTSATGLYSHAEGSTTKASGTASHAQGNVTVALGAYSHAEGVATLASGNISHAEGYYTSATNTGAHAQGNVTMASGIYGHAEGSGTVASGESSHAQGAYTSATNTNTFAAGYASVASGQNSIAMGDNARALNFDSIALGDSGTAAHDNAFVYSNYDTNNYSSYSFSDTSFNVYSLSGVNLFDATTVGDPLSTIKFIVTNDGLVGINDNNPSEQLTVSGNTRMTGTLSALGAGNNFLQGTLSIGTVDLASKLTVKGNVSAFGTLSATSPNYFPLLLSRGISAIATDVQPNILQGRLGVNTYPTSSYAMHVKGGNIRVDGVDYSAVPGFDGTAYDTDGQSLFDLRSGFPNANYSLSIAQSGLGNFMKFFGGRASDDKSFINVMSGTPLRFGWFSDFYGRNYNEHMRIGRTGNVGIHTNHPWVPGQYDLPVDEALTVNGNVSANGSIITTTLSSRYINLVHSPANDGTNPFLRIGEFDTGTGNVGFSGFSLTYNETGNNLVLQNPFAPTNSTILSADRFGNFTIYNTLSVFANTQLGDSSTDRTTIFGTISSQLGLSAANVTLTNATKITPLTVTDNGEFLIININGTNKAIRLWDYTT
jgi:hypothetical protein